MKDLKNNYFKCLLTRFKEILVSGKKYHAQGLGQLISLKINTTYTFLDYFMKEIGPNIKENWGTNQDVQDPKGPCSKQILESLT